MDDLLIFGKLNYREVPDNSPRAVVIHEALTPDKHDRALKQERLAEMTGLTQQVVSDYGQFGHFIFYTSSERIKPTLLQPLFFEKLTLTHFLRLLGRTESKVGPRIARRIEAQAKERQKTGKSADGQAGGRGKKKQKIPEEEEKPSGNLPEGFSENGRSREQVAATVGMSHDTYRKAEAVVAAAEADPEAFNDLPPIIQRA
jgi:hypothetical protein